TAIATIAASAGIAAYGTPVVASTTNTVITSIAGSPTSIPTSNSHGGPWQQASRKLLSTTAVSNSSRPTADRGMVTPSVTGASGSTCRNGPASSASTLATASAPYPVITTVRRPGGQSTSRSRPWRTGSTTTRRHTAARKVPGRTRTGGPSACNAGGGCDVIVTTGTPPSPPVRPGSPATTLRIRTLPRPADQPRAPGPRARPAPLRCPRPAAAPARPASTAARPARPWSTGTRTAAARPAAQRHPAPVRLRVGPAPAGRPAPAVAAWREPGAAPSPAW